MPEIVAPAPPAQALFGSTLKWRLSRLISIFYTGARYGTESERQGNRQSRAASRQLDWRDAHRSGAHILAERLARERLKRGRPGNLADELQAIFRRLDALPELDPRSADDIIGYDEHGLPR